MTSLHVICGLGAPQSKILAMRMSLPTNNLKGALLHLKKYCMEKVVRVLH